MELNFSFRREHVHCYYEMDMEDFRKVWDKGTIPKEKDHIYIHEKGLFIDYCLDPDVRYDVVPYLQIKPTFGIPTPVIQTTETLRTSSDSVIFRKWQALPEHWREIYCFLVDEEFVPDVFSPLLNR